MQDTLPEGTARATQLAPSAVIASALIGRHTCRLPASHMICSSAQSEDLRTEVWLAESFQRGHKKTSFRRRAAHCWLAPRIYGNERLHTYLLVRLRVRPERHRAQSCAIALRSPAPERSSDLKRYSQIFTSHRHSCLRTSRCLQPAATGNRYSKYVLLLHTATGEVEDPQLIRNVCWIRGRTWTAPRRAHPWRQQATRQAEAAATRPDSER